MCVFFSFCTDLAGGKAQLGGFLRSAYTSKCFIGTNRLNKTESAVFKLLMLYFQRTPVQIIKRLQPLSLCRLAVIQSLSEHRYSNVIFILSGPLGL